MGRIPTVTSEVTARVGRSNQGVPSPRATPDDFGAGVGRAIQGVGAGLDDLAQGVSIYREKKRDESVANRVALSDFTSRELELRNQVGADGSGYQERVLEEYDAWVDEQAEAIDDDKVRKEYKQRMMAQRTNLSSRAAQYEFGAAAEHSETEFNAAITSLDNRIRLQPGQFDTLLQQGVDAINASTSIPAGARAKAVIGWTQNASRSYFEGRLEAARDVHDVDAIMQELQQDEWTSRLSSSGMDAMLSDAKTVRSAIQTKADADARAAVDFLEGRSDDITHLIPPEEIQAAQKVVANSENPITQARMARIARDQQIIRSNRRMTPAQQRAANTNALPNATAGMPPPVAEGILMGSRSFGVSASYLAGMVQSEYGGLLKTGDYGKQNLAGDSSATGVAQIIDSTMLSQAARPDVRAAVFKETGIDMSGMSKTEILGLRADPAVSIIVAAAYASQNAAVLRPVLGREPNDAELYMAHFLGGGGARLFFSAMAGNPDTLAADILPKQAAANKTVFYDGDRKRTVTEVLNLMGSKVTGSSSYVQYGDAETRQRVLSDTEKGLRDDAMSFAYGVGVTTLSDVTTPEGMAQRGKEAKSVADYYNIPQSEMKPFTKSEENVLAQQMANGSADDVLSLLTSIQGLGGKMADAGMRQISELNEVYGYAGAMNNATGNSVVASDVVRGQKRIEENPDMRTLVGMTDLDLSSAFYGATGGALTGLSGRDRENVQRAALAHYVETTVARGGGGRFDKKAYTASVNAVLGARPGGTVIETVNGHATVLPRGVDGELMEQAFEAMDASDWTAMSEQKLPPRYADGTVADPRDLQDEARLQVIGNGRYNVMMDDGSYLVTGRPGPNGRVETFVLVPDEASLKRVVAESRKQEAREKAAVNTAPLDLRNLGVSQAELDALASKYKLDVDKASQDIQDYLDGLE